MGRVDTIEKTYCPECGGEFDPGTRNCPEDGSRLYSYKLRNEDNDPLVGETVDDRFLIDGVIGEGGMGRVYRGVQLSVQRPVALKVLRPELIDRENVIQRFLREARVISSFSHPNIVNMVEFGQDSERDLLYLAMELLDGVSLSEVLQRGRAHPNLVCEIAIQVCQGLAEAHEREIVHRDLKPDNLMMIPMSDGSLQVKVLDFGIAHAVQGEQRLTSTGQVFGTAHYMAPEQAGGNTISPSTDVYALGCILYEMVCGQLPFNAASVMGLLVAHVQQTPPHLNERVVDEDFPQEMIDLVMEMLEKAPEDRPASVIEVRNRLEEMRTEHRWGPLRLERGKTLEAALTEGWLRGSITPRLSETSDALERVTGGSAFETAETAAHPSAPSIEDVPNFEEGATIPAPKKKARVATTPESLTRPDVPPVASVPPVSDPSIEMVIAEQQNKRLYLLAAGLLLAVLVVAAVLLQVANSMGDSEALGAAGADAGATTPTAPVADAKPEPPTIAEQDAAAGVQQVDAGMAAASEPTEKVEQPEPPEPLKTPTAKPKPKPKPEKPIPKPETEPEKPAKPEKDTLVAPALDL